MLQPIDVIKTRLQLDKSGKYKGEAPSTSRQQRGQQCHSASWYLRPGGASAVL